MLTFMDCIDALGEVWPPFVAGNDVLIAYCLDWWAATPMAEA